jgi:hypothetical protein
MRSSLKIGRTKGARISASNLRKHRKTFSLSKDTVEFLESFRRDRGEPSLTAALEAILRERRRQTELNALSANVSAYYNSLSAEERKAENTWGEFAESQLADPDR